MVQEVKKTSLAFKPLFYNFIDLRHTEMVPSTLFISFTGWFRQYNIFVSM